MTLIEKLEKLSDTRVSGRSKYKTSFVLILDILGKICGYSGILAKKEFIKNHQEILKEIFQTTKFPSPNTFTRVKEKLNFEELNQILFEHFSNKNSDTNVIHLDGKAIKSSVKNHNEKQTFEAIVTAFTGKLALSSKAYKNDKVSEITIFRELVQSMGLTNVIITGDALHSSKKQLS